MSRKFPEKRLDRTFVASKATMDHGIPGLPVHEHPRAAVSAIT